MAVDMMVSVVMPTHNRLGYLSEAIASVRAQSYSLWELLVIDDGSTDGTQSYVSGINDARVRLIAHERCGNPARLRNAGICAARGAYVAFLDSDDLWLPTKLDVQLKALCAHGECSWSYTPVLLIDADGRLLQRPPGHGKPFYPYSGDIVKPLLVHDAIVSCPTVLVAKTAITSVGGFDESLRFCEDYDLFLRLADTNAVWAIPEFLTKVRHHPGNSTRGVIEVTTSFAEVYAKFRRTQRQREIKRLCNKQRVFYTVRAVEQLFERAALRRGFRLWLRAARSRPLYWRLWYALLKGTLGLAGGP